MANRPCIQRLQKEYKHLQKEPAPNITAHPSPSNILEWHYALEGPADTDDNKLWKVLHNVHTVTMQPLSSVELESVLCTYASKRYKRGFSTVGGVYHGKVVFPAQYPYKPPSIQMFTPSGRFQTNTKLCLSMTDFHPESWNPLWSIGTILTGLLSFMTDTAQTTGSMSSSLADKKLYAQLSLEYNSKNVTFRKLFPEWCEELKRRQLELQQKEQQQQQKPAQSAGEGLGAPDAAAAVDVPAGGADGPLSWIVTVVIILVAAAVMLVPFAAS